MVDQIEYVSRLRTGRRLSKWAIAALAVSVAVPPLMVGIVLAIRNGAVPGLMEEEAAINFFIALVVAPSAVTTVAAIRVLRSVEVRGMAFVVPAMILAILWPVFCVCVLMFGATMWFP